MKEVWYVRGADPDTRYARIFYRSVWEEEDLKQA